jgi:predicted DNA-binding transcriptional regulator AlpA
MVSILLAAGLLNEDPDQLVNSTVVAQLLGLGSLMSVWRRRQIDPDFPAPVRIAARNYWRLGEIRAYVNRKPRVRVRLGSHTEPADQ